MATSDPGAHPPALDQRHLIDALVQVSFVTMAVLSKVGAEHDLSLTQLRVLGILRDRRVMMTRLADYLGLEKSTMTGLVDRAAKRGLLERGPNAHDGRAVDVFLSPAGAALAVRFQPQVRRSLSPLISELGPAEQRQVRTLLERMLGP